MVEVPGFRIHGKVLEPATGALFRAIELVGGRTVALKQVRTTSPEATARLHSVVETLARSPHPHLVDLYRVVETPESAWLVHEWVDGTLLDQLPGGVMNARQTVATVAGLLHGLTHAHHLGLVHGDVSPATVVITASGLPRLFDLGLAGPGGATGASATDRFASPESRSGQALTPASDVYSVAGLLARLLSRTPRTAAPPVAAIPAELRPVLNQALSPAPEDRYPTAGDLLRAIDLAAQQSFGLGWLGSATFPSLPSIPRQRDASSATPASHPAAAG